MSDFHTPCLAASAPSSNTGRNDLALIDFLGVTVSVPLKFRYPLDAGQGVDIDFRLWLEQVIGGLNVGVEEISICKSGWNGYLYRWKFVRSGESIGLVGFGGKNQNRTIHLELTGRGCAGVADWGRVKRIFQSLEAKLTRVDLAHDDFHGVDINIENALSWYEAGFFANGGRPPIARYIDDLGCGGRKTFYVGSRQSGKICRIYEKGKQLGAPDSEWVRAEVEFRSRNRTIPWEVLVRPGDYLCGAYPVFERLGGVQKSIRTTQKIADVTYERLVRWLYNSAGQSLNVLLAVNGGDIAAVFDQIRRDGLPRRWQPFSREIGYTRTNAGIMNSLGS